jgi:integrase
MQKVWHRKFDCWWYATFTEAGLQKQIKLIKAPHDRQHKKLAEQKLLEEPQVRSPHRDVRKAAPDWLTVRGVLKGFLRFSKRHHEPTTYDWYRNFFRSFARRFGGLRVNQLAKKHVTSWIKKSGYNPTSSNRAVGALKAAFNWAVSEEHIASNPIAHVKKPRGLVRDRVLTFAERRLILDSIRNQFFRDFVMAVTLTGCRPGEVAKVSAEHIDLARGVWVFAKHKTVNKTGKARIVYLCPEAVELTKRLLAKYPDGPILRNARGKPWTRNAIRIRFRNLRKKFPELKGVVAYTLRSSFATDALEAGVPDATVSTLLGHTNTATLHKFYARLSHKVTHLQQAAQKATQDHQAGRAAPPDNAA